MEIATMMTKTVLSWLVLRSAFARLKPKKRIGTNAELSLQAHAISGTLWRFDDVLLFTTEANGATSLFLQHYSWSNMKVALRVEPNHPDFERFLKLEGGEVLDFEFLDQGIETLEGQLCGYLRLRAISESVL